MGKQYAARSLAESGAKPLILANSREEAARKALKRAGRSYVITWELVPTLNPAEHRLEHRKAHHPDDIQA